MMANNLNQFGTGPIDVFCISGMFAGGWVWRPMLEALDPSQVRVTLMNQALCEISANFNELKSYICD